MRVSRRAYLGGVGQRGLDRGPGCAASVHPGGSNTHLRVHRKFEGVGVPGYERQTVERAHFQAGQTPTCAFIASSRAPPCVLAGLCPGPAPRAPLPLLQGGLACLDVGGCRARGGISRRAKGAPGRSRGVGVPGCERRPLGQRSVQASQRATHLNSQRRRDGVPGSERPYTRRTHFQAGQRAHYLGPLACAALSSMTSSSRDASPPPSAAWVKAHTRDVVRGRALVG